MTAQPTTLQEQYFLPSVPNTSRLTLRSSGAPLLVVSGVYTLLARDGSTLTTGATSDDAGTATFTVEVADWGPVDEETYGRGYTEVWSEVATAEGTFTFTRPVAASLAVPANPLTDLDLEAMHSGILAEAPDGSDPNVPADVGWSAKRGFAFRRLLAKLREGIVDPTAVLSWESFLEYLSYDSLWLICWDLATEERGRGKWTLKAEEYGTMRDSAWERVLFDVDRNRDGVADTDGPSQVSAVGHGGHPGQRRW